jgi:hypothetical protein
LIGANGKITYQMFGQKSGIDGNGSDVILHIRYTAREGGGLLRNGAVANFNEQIAEAQTVETFG